jgi:tRNA threonylcarbamoyladenosine biosynthesis protein TsaE
MLGEVVGGAVVIWLSGELGAGKTCFTQGLARGLAVPPDEAVTSPSYALMNHYRGRFELYHFDLYRLSHPGELEDLDFDAYVHGDGVTVVEWADRFPHLETDGMQVLIEHRGEELRRVSFRALNRRCEELLTFLAFRWREKGTVA